MNSMNAIKQPETHRPASTGTAGTRSASPRIRTLAGLTALGMALALYVLGAQEAAQGLFRAPWDKLAHALTFAIIGAATGLASGRRGWPLLAFCLLGATAVGALDEWHQRSLPGRSADLLDLLADAVGGAIGAGALSLAFRLGGRR